MFYLFLQCFRSDKSSIIFFSGHGYGEEQKNKELRGYKDKYRYGNGVGTGNVYGYDYIGTFGNKYGNGRGNTLTNDIFIYKNLI
jgi:hypothetical protein